jgi:hypothetical protein
MNATIAEAETKAAMPVRAEEYRQMDCPDNVAISVSAMSVCGSFDEIAQIIDLAIPLRRPPRRPRRTVADEARILAEDTELVKRFAKGVSELEGGSGVAWDDLKRELGL